MIYNIYLMINNFVAIPPYISFGIRDHFSIWMQFLSWNGSYSKREFSQEMEQIKLHYRYGIKLGAMHGYGFN